MREMQNQFNIRTTKAIYNLQNKTKTQLSEKTQKRAEKKSTSFLG